MSALKAVVTGFNTFEVVPVTGTVEVAPGISGVDVVSGIAAAVVVSSNSVVGAGTAIDGVGAGVGIIAVAGDKGGVAATAGTMGGRTHTSAASLGSCGVSRSAWSSLLRLEFSGLLIGERERDRRGRLLGARWGVPNPAYGNGCGTACEGP